MKIFSLIKEHEKYRKKTLNLVAAENLMSPLVRQCMSSDLGNRYSSAYYGGTKFIRQIHDCATELATEVFDCECASVFPVSGHLCNLAAILDLTNKGDKIAMVSTTDGGYPFNLKIFDRIRLDLPFDKMNLNIDTANIEDFLRNTNPALVMLGTSFFLFPHPVKEISKICNELEISVVYDGSHVLGLIAGHEFQDPLKEGSPILFGSTHKSFPGPQSGLLLGSTPDIFWQIADLFEMQNDTNLFDKNKGTVLVDNYHAHRVAALGVALAEMKKFGDAYISQMLKNSRIIAKSLHDYGIDMVGSKLGFSASHQIVLNTCSLEEGAKIKDKLEECHILIDMGGRLSPAEITRRGMKESECIYIAELIRDSLFDERRTDLIKRDILNLLSGFQTVHYTFSEISEVL
jgi:glycine hydroxymethyltransferase